MVVSEAKDLRRILDQNITYIRSFLAKSENIVIREVVTERFLSIVSSEIREVLNCFISCLDKERIKKQKQNTITKYTEASTQKGNARSLDKRQK
ncbi:Multidrug resistance-associated protein 1 [Sesbania bispinosa]|nr:Multidrug resistance-associated protein 1 [Sesbania bispinosa]